MRCKRCDKKCYGEFCLQHKPRKLLPRSTKAIPKQSQKEKDYQAYKETVLRPAIIKRDGDACACCGRQARDGEKLDIDHIQNKGSHIDLKRTLSNLQLLCRTPCHFRKTNNIPCVHSA